MKTKTTSPRSATAAPVTGTVRMVCTPLAPCTLCPHGQSGTVVINGANYAVAYLTEPSDQGPQITGYRLLSGEANLYDLPADLSSCDCPDGCYRVRPGGCKHARALGALKRAGKLA